MLDGLHGTCCVYNFAAECRCLLWKSESEKEESEEEEDESEEEEEESDEEEKEEVLPPCVLHFCFLFSLFPDFMG